MEAYLRKLEIFADRAIPYCLIILLITIITELFAHDFAVQYHLYITIIDSIVILIFVIDLVFKYVRARNVKDFLRRYWIEILAVFPAFLVVRIVEEFIIIANLDSTLLLSQEALEFGERTGVKANRVHYFGRFIQPLARIPRFFKAFHFYERPHVHFKI